MQPLGLCCAHRLVQATAAARWSRVRAVFRSQLEKRGLQASPGGVRRHSAHWTPPPCLNTLEVPGQVCVWRNVISESLTQAPEGISVE